MVCNKCLKEQSSYNFYAGRRACKSCHKIRYTSKEVKERNKLRMRKANKTLTNDQKIHRLAVNRAWRSKNADRLKNAELKFFYGISLAQYNSIKLAQNNLCAICNQPAKGKRPLALDHDHSTGVVRGLLCYGCNRGLSLMDNKILFVRALEYINKGAVK